MSFLLSDIPANPLVDRFVDLSFEVSERVIRILEEKGMSQRDLAKQLGKKDSEISKWLQGNHNFTLRTIAAIEVALDKEFIKVEGLESIPIFCQELGQVNIISVATETEVGISHHASYVFNDVKEKQGGIYQLAFS